MKIFKKTKNKKARGIQKKKKDKKKENEAQLPRFPVTFPSKPIRIHFKNYTHALT